MIKHFLRLAGWSLFEKGVEKTVDAKLGHLFGPGTAKPKPRRNPLPPTVEPYDPEDDDDEDDDEEFDDDDEFEDDDDDEDEDDEDDDEF